MKRSSRAVLPALAAVLLLAALAAALSHAARTKPAAQADAADTAEAEALRMTEVCRDAAQTASDAWRYGIALPQDALTELAASIAAAYPSAAVCGVDGAAPMRNVGAIDMFLAGGDTLTICEVCLDAGLLCHRFTRDGDAVTVTRTRTVWTGGAPAVGYSETCAVTDLTRGADTLHYAYDMPDNPPGTDHDGHIDTEKTFALAGA